MVIGRRTNVRWSNTYSQTYLPEKVADMAKTSGRLYMFSAIDYFIISPGSYPWHRIPADVVVARRGYDNFLVLMAIRDNVSVIDATRTLLAVHQTDFEGNLAGLYGKDANYNVRRLGNFNFRKGMTSSAQYETKFEDSSNTSIVVVRREQHRTEQRRTSKSVQKVNISAPTTTKENQNT